MTSGSWSSIAPSNGTRSSATPALPSRSSGSVAEYAVAVAGSPLVERRPAVLDPVRAAAIPEVALTALTLMRAGRPEPGETVLVVGASGGIGMVLVPLSASAGATVIATATAGDDAYVRALGAAETVDYTVADPAEEALRRHSGGVDVLFNLALDGPALSRAARAVRPGGRLVSAPPIRDTGGYRDDLTVASLFLAAEPGDLEDLGRRAASGVLRVEVASVYPFEHAARAFVDHLERHSRGKRVVAIRESS